MEWLYMLFARIVVGGLELVSKLLCWNIRQNSEKAEAAWVEAEQLRLELEALRQEKQEAFDSWKAAQKYLLWFTQNGQGSTPEAVQARESYDAWAVHRASLEAQYRELLARHDALSNDAIGHDLKNAQWATAFRSRA